MKNRKRAFLAAALIAGMAVAGVADARAKVVGCFFISCQLYENGEFRNVYIWDAEYWEYN